MAHMISLFNHKGGAAKTTTTFNLGWMLAIKGKNVLLVDLDPQCNLTGMVLRFEHEENTNRIEGNRNESPKNIRDGLSPAFESRPSPIVAADCIPIDGTQRLFLLPGHIGLAEYEVTLGIAQELSGSLVTLRNLPGSIRHLIDRTAERYGIDVVVADTNPSLGPLNQNILMTSDYFIVPMFPDYFATMAIRSLTSVLPKWKKWADAAKTHPVLQEAEYAFPVHTPRFLGYVVQNYRLYGDGPTKAFQRWVDQIGDGIRNELVPALEKNGMTLLAEKVGDNKEYPYKPILKMPNFNSLIAKSQEQMVPVFQLRDDQLQQGGVVLKNTRESMEKFRKLFSDTADFVIRVLG